MKISYNWLKDLIDLKKYPAPKLADLLTMNFAEVDGIEEVGNDSIFDLKILPDRASDCLSHFGVAREIAVLTQGKVKAVEVGVKENKKEKIGKFLTVKNENPEICKRYVARVVKDVKIGPSPKWLAQRLETIGQKSINNVVDATNFVMFELGQPMHAFDYDKLGASHEIVIRKADVKEKIVTLDNQEIELSREILVVADSKEPLAIAGVKGGKKAEIDNNTKNIVLESANFSAESIRKASRLTGVRTDSSTRFAADLDPTLAGVAMERLASLINQIAGGETISGKIDIYPRKAVEQKVAVSVGDINETLGTTLSEKEILNIFKKLSLKVKKVSQSEELLKLAKKMIGKPYKYGASTSQDAPKYFDCSSFTQYLYWQAGFAIPRVSVEQFLYGYQIEKKDLRIGDLAFRKGGKPYFYKETPKGVGHVGIYVGNGKIIHASGDKKKVVEEKVDVFCKKDFRGFRRMTDLSEDVFVVEIPTYRRDMKLKADIIEEIGRIYGYENILSRAPEGFLIPPKRNDELFWENMAKNALVSAGFAEAYNYSFIGENDLRNIVSGKSHILQLENYLSDDRKYLRPSLLFGFISNARENFKYFDTVRIFESGRVYSVGDLEKVLEKKMLGGIISYKSGKDKAVEFYEIKGAVDLLAEKMGIPEIWYDDYEVAVDSFENGIWHGFRVAEIKIGDEKIGVAGEINPKILDAYGITGRVAAFEIDFEKLARLADEDRAYRPISKFPAIERDLAILAPIDIKVEDVLNVLENVGGRLLVDTDLFDVYEGDNIPQGQKSLAFHLIFQSQEKTLSDKEIDEIMTKIVSALAGQGWEAR